MAHYLIKRMLLIIPTLVGILTINFFIVQITPGGPVEQMLMKIEGTDADVTTRFTSGNAQVTPVDLYEQQAGSPQTTYRGARGLDPAFVRELEARYGFDQPLHKRYWKLLSDYARFDLGRSYFRDAPVASLIVEKLPVSISLGLWSTLLIYLVSIPLGILKAVRDGTPFDAWTSSVVVIAYAIPSFLFAIALVIFLAGGSFLSLFPLSGLTSEGFASFSLGHKVVDYFWHITLPVLALTVGGFASLTFLTKNSFLDEINKHYVVTARAKGLSSGQILYRHVFRNAMLVVISSMPAKLMHIFLTGSILIEVIFSLDGLGLLGFEAAVSRDYPVVFGTLFIFTLLSLVVHLAGDIVYTKVDPRIDFATREGVS